MRWSTAAFAALLALTLSTSGFAVPPKDADGTPAADEIATIDACLEQALKDKQPFKTCVGKAVAVCLDKEQPGTVFDCQRRETEIWRRKLATIDGEIRAHAPTKATREFREVARAWDAYVERKCTVIYVFGRGSTGDLKWEHGCRLDETAQRMAEQWGWRDWLKERDWFKDRRP
jgi:uncharacterized protein YecT (DUF1311 family)